MSTHPVESGRSERRAATAAERRKLNFKRHFTRPGRHPYDEVAWEMRSAVINDERGQPVFEQHDIEVPATWSQTATNIVASKYFRGQLGSPERETQRARPHLARGRHHRGLGRDAGLLRDRRRPAGVLATS